MKQDCLRIFSVHRSFILVSILNSVILYIEVNKIYSGSKIRNIKLVRVHSQIFGFPAALRPLSFNTDQKDNFVAFVAIIFCLRTDLQRTGLRIVEENNSRLSH